METGMSRVNADKTMESNNEISPHQQEHAAGSPAAEGNQMSKGEPDRNLDGASLMQCDPPEQAAEVNGAEAGVYLGADVPDERAPDSEGLGFWTNTPPGSGDSPAFKIGYVSAVNGTEAEECEEFKPTRYELQELARVWYRSYLHDDLEYFFLGQMGSGQMRWQPYAMRRIERIQSIIGEKALKEVFDSVEEEEHKKVGDRYWNIYKHGSAKEWAEVQEEIERKLDEQMGRQPSGAEDGGSADEADDELDAHREEPSGAVDTRDGASESEKPCEQTVEE